MTQNPFGGAFEPLNPESSPEQAAGAGSSQGPSPAAPLDDFGFLASDASGAFSFLGEPSAPSAFGDAQPSAFDAAPAPEAAQPFQGADAAPAAFGEMAPAPGGFGDDAPSAFPSADFAAEAPVVSPPGLTSPGGFGGSGSSFPAPDFGADAASAPPPGLTSPGDLGASGSSFPAPDFGAGAAPAAFGGVAPAGSFGGLAPAAPAAPAPVLGPLGQVLPAPSTGAGAGMGSGMGGGFAPVPASSLPGSSWGQGPGGLGNQGFGGSSTSSYVSSSYSSNVRVVSSSGRRHNGLMRWLIAAAVVVAAAVGVGFGIDRYKTGKYCDAAIIRPGETKLEDMSSAELFRRADQLKKYAPLGAKDAVNDWWRELDSHRELYLSLDRLPPNSPEFYATVLRLEDEVDFVELARLDVQIDADLDKRCPNRAKD